MQAEAPEFAWYWPEVQLVQKLEPAGEKRPEGQAAQVDESLASTVAE